MLIVTGSAKNENTDLNKDGGVCQGELLEPSLYDEQIEDTRSGNILSFLLPLFQEGQLSVTGEITCTKYWLTA